MEGAEGREAIEFFLWSLSTRNDYVEQSPCAYQGIHMSVFMEKSGAGEGSSHSRPGLSLQLRARGLTFVQALWPHPQSIRAPTRDSLNARDGPANQCNA